ncbi:hypothetical protein WR25_22725 [Diploscapter pachys]|uniref:Uncharacterized protein n=1 Tax=Diploscapter pachys TaxID=2018661 RepID=A0A2A2KUY3_9BILA|nr:hypothetical protein WR25_22725 [Diploscapter pachys]
MTDEDKEVNVDELEEGPGKSYEFFTKNEELLAKLKLLGYEKEFLKLNKSYRHMHKHYFVRQTNAGEQFFLLTAVAAWLIRKGGNDKFEMPQEFDDPNSTIASILAELRAKVR